MSSVEPLLDEENRRFTLFPIKYPSLFDMYKKQLSAFWKAEEIDFSNDYYDYLQLNDDEKHFIEMTLAFFAASDGIVNFNLSTRFLQDIKVMEAQVVYTFQMMMENVHSETYSLMLDNIVRDKDRKEFLFNSIENVSSVKMMADWAFKWIDSDLSFAHRVIAFAVVEGIFFSGAFASIFWLKKYKASGKRFLDGLIKSNEFIARDEGMHTDFACLIYSLLQKKLSFDEVKAIVCEGVEIAKTFVEDALPVRLIGMNNESMSNYIEYVADRLFVVLGYSKVYNSKNPFAFMETIGMVQKTNFFETRPTEYQSAHVFNKSEGKLQFELDDF
jgi:ribonucleotide reductase beta subunit family protein with ferritin-like domain